MNYLAPELLKALLHNDMKIQRATALLDDDWSRLFTKSLPFDRRWIDADAVTTARQLLNTGLISTSWNLQNYPAVRKFMVENANYLVASGKRALLSPFQD